MEKKQNNYETLLPADNILYCIFDCINYSSQTRNKSENLCISDYFIPCGMCSFPYFRRLSQKYDPKFRL